MASPAPAACSIGAAWRRRCPSSVGERTEETTGQRWITADVSLAPLSPGDYVIEVTIAKEAGEERVLTPIRVVR